MCNIRYHILCGGVGVRAYSKWILRNKCHCPNGNSGGDSIVAGKDNDRKIIYKITSTASAVSENDAFK